jgi:hypothetical protein
MACDSIDQLASAVGRPAVKRAKKWLLSSAIPHRYLSFSQVGSLKLATEMLVNHSEGRDLREHPQNNRTRGLARHERW